MEYNFREIEKKWQDWWKDNKIYQVSNPGHVEGTSKPKCYVLDMFPYPSGAGLHVGHPLGYIASDIYSRYKRLKGFNVLHPMGYDAFGLPAEQYAIEHGIHPAVSTEDNIKNFRSQLDKIGFCYDWNREVNTSRPGYYKWTQWIFLQLFNSYFCHTEKKALPISKLIAKYETKGAMPKTGEPIPGKHFTAAQWKAFSEKEKADILMKRRLAYCGYGEVNWCEALGTVLANDEVVNGVSERGGYPVVKKTLRQWYLRITEYADRLLEGLDKVDFSDAMKEMQGNWIGKSMGAEIDFKITGEAKLRVYTTRPDTIFGVDFMVIAPEHILVEEIATAEQRQAVEEYIAYVKSRSERERMAEKKISGVFTGAYALNPFNGREIPVWISEYVLAGYGTGAIMGVPCGDERDHKFAKHFNIPVTNIIGEYYNGEDANPTYDAKLENSDFLNGIEMRKAIDIVIAQLELAGMGHRKVNYKMRDAAFSRQRYWGEPFPIIWKNDIAYPLDESELPVKLPHVDSYRPGPEGEGPLANIKDWVVLNKKVRSKSWWIRLLEKIGLSRPKFETSLRETNTMPGYAGSSWYFLRYMDPHNDKEFCSRKASDYWGQVDLYIGGTEHAVGHLLYSRMWTKFLFDIGLIGHDEPYKRLVNQGMITGFSYFITLVSAYKEPLEADILTNTGKPIVRKRTGKLLYTSSPMGLDLGFSLTIQSSNGETYFNPEVIMPYRLKNIQDYIEFKDYGGYRLTRKNLEKYLEVVGEEFAGFKLEDVVFDNYLKQSTGEDVLVVEMQVEKMSKSKFNTTNPDDLIAKYGADTFRMYEMFLGPVEMSKPWDTKGIEGVHRFLKKFWRLFADEMKGLIVNNEEPTAEELKVFHNTIRKIENDTERFSFNTGVSAFMIATNELTDMKCNKRKILEPLLILLAPYAPHISEELWHQLGNKGSILDAVYPLFEEKYVKETTKAYPVAINGKTRAELTLSLDATQEQVEQMVLQDPVVQKWLDGKPPKKVIYVRNKMINVVV